MLNSRKQNKKAEIYRPVYHSPPNTFIEYEEREFNDGAGHFGIERVAIFLNKKGKRSEMTAQIIWLSK